LSFEIAGCQVIGEFLDRNFGFARRQAVSQPLIPIKMRLLSKSQTMARHQKWAIKLIKTHLGFSYKALAKAADELVGQPHACRQNWYAQHKPTVISSKFIE
jgi:hypothetical protein